MLPRQKLFAILISIGLILVIVDLVRRRKLREEYSWLWLMSGAVIFILAVWYDLLAAIGNFIGVIVPTSTLFFFGLIFLVLISLHFSVKVSSLTNQVKKLAQELAMLEERKDA
ncbi:MAG: DUF2304 domain-containing protein [Candidatus Omnitrophica bacterium]|nr:DUF2304 domain-containing protein [Candidatus Omnitrophota bacterium]